MIQEFDLTPSRKKSRRFWFLSGCAFLLFIAACLAGAIAGSALLRDRLLNQPDEVTVTESVSETQSDDQQRDQVVNRISFVDEEGRLGTIAPDGGDLRMLADDTAIRYVFPAWSPDSRHIAAIGAGLADSGVYLFEDQEAMPENGPQSLYLSSTELPFYLYWSPDSRQVTFLANHPDGIGLHLAQLGEEPESRLLLTGSPFYWHWSMTGDSLFFHTGLAAVDARLAFLDTDSLESGEDLGRPGFFQAPGISSDGRFLAFAEVDEAGDRWVVIADEAGNEQSRLRHFGTAALGWNPAAPQLALLSPTLRTPHGSGFFGSLRLFDIETKQEQILSDALVLAFFWSPDGQKLAYLTLGEERDDITAYRRNPDAQAGRFSQPAQQQEGPLRFDLHIYDMEAGSSALLLTFQPTRVYLEQYLPFFDQYALSHRIWAPDSESLVLPLLENDQAHLYVVPLDDVPRFLVEGEMGFWSYR
jgi:Tol biopolymer transport system component